eukprot:2838146-Pyramimonas_sp.AAC.1
METAAVADVVGRGPEDLTTEDTLLQALHTASRDPGPEPRAKQNRRPGRGDISHAPSNEVPVHLPLAEGRNEPKTHT